MPVFHCHKSLLTASQSFGSGFFLSFFPFSLWAAIDNSSTHTRTSVAYSTYGNSFRRDARACLRPERSASLLCVCVLFTVKTRKTTTATCVQFIKAFFPADAADATAQHSSSILCCLSQFIFQKYKQTKTGGPFFPLKTDTLSSPVLSLDTHNFFFIFSLSKKVQPPQSSRWKMNFCAIH